ncbi:MAG: inositol monophosphatase family protein [Thiotrichales bacterium]|jgi:myo-inositol-1(or 4)-monophosphatase|nr:inositol monophosphatase family protein [Thiotrichales bacterium]
MKSLNDQQWTNLTDEIRVIAQDIFNRVATGRQNMSRKQDGSLVTETDIALQQAISNRLLTLFPSIPVLGEEMSETEQNSILSTGTCWLLDPLDGTSNFSHGIPVYAVSLALLLNGEVVAGMVYDPNRDECFSAQKGKGAYLNKLPLITASETQDSNLKHAMAIIDTKRLTTRLAQAISSGHPYHSQRSFGSVAIDWCWLAAGRVQTYLHGKQKLWDFAAGALIAEEAGCLAHTLDRTSILSAPLTLEARSAVGACPELTSTWPEWIQAHQ